MTMSDSNGMTSGINVTPMIDILLVLLIIFMVIVPTTPKGETAQLPEQQMSHGQASPGTVVLEVLKGNGGELAFRINQQALTRQDLPARLASIYANRAERVLFLKGDDQLSFNQVAEVIDIGHAAGVERVGLMTPQVLAGR
jgi:biopolymer transport protein TolR